MYKYRGGQWFNNMVRDPLVVLSYIKADGPHYYKYITEYDLKYSKGEVRYFRIKMLGNNQTYQYEVGMTMADWVRSKYNTDGWRFDSKEPYVVVSPDGKYKLSENEFCFGELSAQRHNSAK